MKTESTIRPPHSRRRVNRSSRLAGAWLIAWCLLGGMIAGGKTALFGRGIAPARPASARIASNSVTSKTIPVARRTKSIEDVRVGDLVISRDEKTGRIEPRRVLETYKRVSNHLRVLKIRSSDGIEQEIKTTDEHPFWVVGKGWVKAACLLRGNPLLLSDGSIAIIHSSHLRHQPKGIHVFNLQVEDYHSYFASENKHSDYILVHNGQYKQYYTEPSNLWEQLALEEAQGSGRKIMENLKDPKYSGWDKYQHAHMNPEGGNLGVIHYNVNPANGEIGGIKFKIEWGD